MSIREVANLQLSDLHVSRSGYADRANQGSCHEAKPYVTLIIILVFRVEIGRSPGVVYQHLDYERDMSSPRRFTCTHIR